MDETGFRSAYPDYVTYDTGVNMIHFFCVSSHNSDLYHVAPLVFHP